MWGWLRKLILGRSFIESETKSVKNARCQWTEHEDVHEDIEHRQKAMAHRLDHIEKKLELYATEVTMFERVVRNEHS